MVDGQLLLLLLWNVCDASKLWVHEYAVVHHVDLLDLLHRFEFKIGKVGDKLAKWSCEPLFYYHLFTLVRCLLDQVEASVEGVFVHLDRELKVVNAEESFQRIDIPKDFHAVRLVIIEKTIDDRQ